VFTPTSGTVGRWFVAPISVILRLEIAEIGATIAGVTCAERVDPGTARGLC
jgi:hypothetical protein